MVIRFPWGARLRTGFHIGKARTPRNGRVPRARKDYQLIFDYLREPAPGKIGIAARALTEIDPPRILKRRDKTATHQGWRRANYVVAVICLVWNRGKPRGLVPGPNPANGVAKVRRPRNAREAVTLLERDGDKSGKPWWKIKKGLLPYPPASL